MVDQLFEIQNPFIDLALTEKLKWFHDGLCFYYTKLMNFIENILKMTIICDFFSVKLWVNIHEQFLYCACHPSKLHQFQPVTISKAYTKPIQSLSGAYSKLIQCLSRAYQ